MKKESELDYEIVIIGGGPAGISTWLHLNKYNPELAKKTILIEKEECPREKLCGGALGGWSDYKLKELDIDIEKIPYISIDTVNCLYGEKTYQHKQKNFFKIVRRLEFDHLLANIAKKRGGKLNQNEEFIDLKKSDDFITVKTSKNNYKTRILIGADGALSNVRKKMILEKKPNIGPAIEIFLPVNEKYDSEFLEKKVTIDFSPIFNGIQGYIWHFPCIYNNEPYMNHGIGDFKFQNKNTKISLKKEFQKSLIRREANIDPKNWKGHPICWLSKENTISNPNIFLVGDAAGIDPAIAGGIHLSLSYGELASKSIKEAYENKDFSFTNYKKELENHLIGKYIFKLSYLADKMYDNKISPLAAVEEIFRKKENN